MRHRLAAIRKSSPRLGAKLYLCGACPSILFDSPVLGAFGRPFKAFRREVGVACGLLGRRRSPDLAFAFAPSKDPKVKAAGGFVLQYCKGIWNAALPPPLRNPAGLPLGKIAMGVKHYLDRNKYPPKLVNGPISALHKTMKEVGWGFHSPLVLVDKAGSHIHVPTTLPVKIRDRFLVDLRETMVRRLILKLYMKSDEEEVAQLYHHGLFVDPFSRCIIASLVLAISKMPAFC